MASEHKKNSSFDVEALVSAQLEGELPPSELADLDRLIRADPDAAMRYVKYVDLHASLAFLHGSADTLQSDTPDADQDTFSEIIETAQHQRQLYQVNTEELADPASRARSIFTIKRSGLAYAAAVLLVAGLVGLFLPWPPSGEVAPGSELADGPSTPADVDQPELPVISLAKVMLTQDARWSEGGPVVGDKMPAGQHYLKTGFVQIEMGNGALVTLQAPNHFELIAEDRLDLISGLLSAHVPERAIGFTVNTPTADYIDLGTDFGVEVYGEGESELHVISGEVRAETHEAQGSEKLVVTGGNAVKVSKDAMDETPAILAQFITDWDYAARTRIRTEDQIRYLYEAPTSVKPGALENDRHIFVFPEQRGVTLPVDVMAAFTEPGQYDLMRRASQGGTIAEGTQVDSYCIHFDRVGRPLHDLGSMAGTVEFDRPILAIIVNDDQLIATDALFAPPGTTYSDDAARGLESWVEPESPIQDRLYMTQDRKRLVVDLNTSYGVDQVRVLVAAEMDTN